MSHYRSNVRDIAFNLFEVFGTDLLGAGPYAEFDPQTVRGILDEVDRMAREDLAASYAEGDRNPPVFDPTNHTVTVPEPLRRSYQRLMDSEFHRLDLPTEIGGTGAPRLVWWTLAELILGGNAAIWMYSSGPAFCNTLWLLGNERQQRWAKLIAEKRWAATMVLTEPDAGSDVGAGRARAIPQPDGTWQIEGVKRFISSGEHDLTDNIIHYVLARPVDTPGAGGPGTKGLSLFVVPKYHFDEETGELTGRNGVFATNLEHKMGLKASATCELSFGQHGVPATGWLLGDVHDGIRQMFKVIEYARMMVGTKAIATLSTGYLQALEYAKQRVQGADMLTPEKSAPRVTITHHPDVRRSLMLQKAYAEGLRALVAYTATWQDRIKLAEAAGDPDAAELAGRINDLLLPVVKGCGSERAYELLGQESLQTFGGSGYLQDYPLEQYVRDAKIDTLYEGTTAIQSLDLVFRKIVKDQGQALLTLSAQIQGFIDAEGGNGLLKEERLALGRALAEVQQMLGIFTGWLTGAAGGDQREVYKVGLNSRRLLLALGDLLVAWLLQRQAEVALRTLAGPAEARPAAEAATGGHEARPAAEAATGGHEARPAAEAATGRGLSKADRSFYEGKVAAARFFASEVLPRLGADRRVMQSTTLDLMDLPEAAF